jgi:maleylacetoacetate isomerase
MRGLRAVEAHLDHPSTGEFCHGDGLSLADVCTVPQLWSARRAGLDLSDCPRLTRIADACAELDAFRRAAPEAQPDFES